MTTDPFIVATALNRCVNQDVCGECPYLEIPGGHYGECINELMMDACEILRTQKHRVYRAETLHRDLKKTNRELQKELKKLREELSRYREVEDVGEWNESDASD